MATHSSILAWRIPGTGAWWAAVYGVGRGGRYLQTRFPEDWASVGCGQRCLSLCIFCGLVEAELTSRDEAGSGDAAAQIGWRSRQPGPAAAQQRGWCAVLPAGGLCATPPGNTGCPHAPASCCGWQSSVLYREAPLRASLH